MSDQEKPSILDQTISLADLAVLLKREKRWINKLVKEKGFPRLRHGEYNLKDAVHWMLDYKDAMIREARQGGDTYIESERRLMAAKAGREEIKLAKDRQQVLSARAVERALSEAITTLRNRMMALPRRLAPQIDGTMKVGQREILLRNHITEALAELANIPDLLELDAGRGDGENAGHDGTIIQKDQAAAASHG